MPPILFKLNLNFIDYVESFTISPLTLMFHHAVVVVFQINTLVDTVVGGMSLKTDFE